MTSAELQLLHTDLAAVAKSASWFCLLLHQTSCYGHGGDRAGPIATCCLLAGHYKYRPIGPFSKEMWAPSDTWLGLLRVHIQPKRYLDRFVRSCVAHDRDQQTNRHTDTQAHRLGYGLTPSVANKPEPHSMHTMRLKSNNDRRFLKNKAIAHCRLRQAIDDAIASLQRYRSIYPI